MSVTFANGGANNYQGNGNSGGAGVTCANASTTGNYMIIAVTAGLTAAQLNGATCNDGTNTYPLIGTAIADSGGNFAIAFYGGVIATGLAGGYVIKTSLPFTTQLRAVELVISGSATVDNGGASASAQSSFTTGGTMQTGNLVLTGTVGKIFTVGMENTSAVTLSVAGGATSLGTVSSVARLMEYLDYATAGTYTGQMTDATGGTTQAILSVALFGTSSGSVAGPMYYQRKILYFI